MNKFTYENQGTNTYLVYRVSEDEVIDSLGLGMITNNSISGLARTMCIQMDNDKFIKYNVSAKVSVSQFFSGAINKARLLGVFNGIVDALINAEEYMIDQDTLVFDLDYIFSDVSTCETVLICLPVLDTEKPAVDLGTFFKNIMFSSQFDQTENCDYVAKIMNYLNSTPAFSFVDFKNVLKEVSNNNTVSQVKDVRPVVKQQAPTDEQPKLQPTVNAVYQPKPQPVAPPITLTTPVADTPAPSVSIPVEPVPSAPVADISGGTPSDEKPMSKLYLMQHYTKENKAIYDAQQAAKKNSNSSAGVDTNKALEEKPMSKLYLLQHYTKENKAIYDAQQAAKKNGAKIQSPKSEPVAKTSNSSAFAVPGASSNNNSGFAIPGQAAPEVSSIKPVVESKPQPVAVPKAEPVKAPVSQPNAPIQSAPIQSAMAPAVSPVLNTHPGSFGETVVLSPSMAGDTTVLNVSMLNQPISAPHLIREKDGQKVYINKPVFRIGKEKSYVDLFIGDNSAISRSHANIIVREDKYFVVDTNSTNHTYVDGNMLQPNNEYEIIHGSKLRFANEDFEFKIY